MVVTSGSTTRSGIKPPTVDRHDGVNGVVFVGDEDEGAGPVVAGVDAVAGRSVRSPSH